MQPRPVHSALIRAQYICPSCACRAQGFRASFLKPRFAKRSITQQSLLGTEEAKLSWDRQASEIKAGRKDSMLTMLERRGLVNQIVGEREDLDRLLTEKRIGVYVGVDPTAPSMHVGHLLPLMALYWMYCYGFRACTLLGSATAIIGDPSDRTTARVSLLPYEQQTNTTKMHAQLENIWAHVERRVRDQGYIRDWAWSRELATNDHWLNNLPVMEFLKVMGSGVRLGTLLGRDTVKNRMKKGSGMSMAEFMYPLLQAWDWWHMYSTKNIQVQVGGSDQFGNILAGMDAINHCRKTLDNSAARQDMKNMQEGDVLHKRPMGLTVPLLTTSSGDKFGKSSGNAVWLDREMTSSFDLYQFFLRTSDADVHRYLKLFTFAPLDHIESIMVQHNKDPSKRVAQHKLARDVIDMVHGKEAAAEAETEHKSVFRSRGAHCSEETPQDRTFVDSKKAFRPKDISQVPNPTAPAGSNLNPSMSLPSSLVYGQPISRVLFHAGLVASKSEGHRLATKGGAYVGARPSNGMGSYIDFAPASNTLSKDTEECIVDGDLLILRIGKWRVKIVKVISDAEFEKQGLTAPDWKAGANNEKASVRQDESDHMQGTSGAMVHEENSVA